MDLGFSGDVSDYYRRYRRGYPPAVIDALVEAFSLSQQDVVLDLGCGTGQLALPIAEHVRAVLGVDPEPDMLAAGRRAARECGVSNVAWMAGSDSELPAIARVFGSAGPPFGAVTIGQALHWMDHETLFGALWPILRHGGGVAIVTNGTPLWLQDSAWSHALREYLEGWLGKSLVNTCGTDDATQMTYRESLAAHGFTVTEHRLAYADELDLDSVVGNIYSAMPVNLLPEDRSSFADCIAATVQPHAPLIEHVRVRILLGTVG